jgi:hypothetical protein
MITDRRVYGPNQCMISEFAPMCPQGTPAGAQSKIGSLDRPKVVEGLKVPAWQISSAGSFKRDGDLSPNGGKPPNVAGSYAIRAAGTILKPPSTMLSCTATALALLLKYAKTLALEQRDGCSGLLAQTDSSAVILSGCGICGSRLGQCWLCQAAMAMASITTKPSSISIESKASSIDAIMMAGCDRKPGGTVRRGCRIA